MSENLKIDFVLPWVDSNDEKWQKVYQENFPAEKINLNRFKDFELLKYWFRGVEKYAPWVNKIHFITFGHLPDFLKLDHPKINIVYHQDYIPTEYLPTFNSHTIELNLHRIKELEEKFVYFNDDMYLIKDIKPDFFFKNELPVHSGILRPIVSPNYYHISEVQQNNLGVSNQNFNFKKQFKENWPKWTTFKYGPYLFSNILFSFFNHAVGFSEDHMPNPLMKSSILDVWNKEHEILRNTSLRKARNIKLDVNQWLFKQWEIMSGNFYPGKKEKGKLVSINTDKDVYNVKEVLNNKKRKIICINDHIEDDRYYQKVISLLDLIFLEHLPKKSSFEL